MLRSSALVCSILWTGAAHAATISIEPAGADKPVVVIVQGAFNPKDGDHFFTKTRPLSAATVRLQSDGGSLLAGVQIGETIRLKGFQTVVLENARCASACAMAWLGGTQRFMGRGAQIGWHAANSQQGSGVPNALIGAYLNASVCPILPWST